MLGRRYCKEVCRREFDSQTFVCRNERSIEYRFIFQHLMKTFPTAVLDVGTGATALPHLMRTCGFHVTAADNINDYWTGGMFNRPFYILDDDIKKPRLPPKV